MTNWYDALFWWTGAGLYAWTILRVLWNAGCYVRNMHIKHNAELSGRPLADGPA